MAVHIDKIDSEIEVVAALEGQGREGRTTPPQTAGTDPAHARRAIRRMLEDELDEFLRIRG